MFAGDADYRFFYLCLRTACERYGCDVHAYVFMTNHVHLLMTPTQSASIARAIQSVGRRYVQYFNNAHGRTGGLWEGRYHSTVVDTERYLAACHQYIEMNPERAGMVAQPADFAWSSHRANATDETDPIVVPHSWYLELGSACADRQEAYRGIFRLDLPNALVSEIRGATQRAWVLGGKQFRAEIESRLGRRTRPLRAGKPAAPVVVERFRSSATKRCATTLTPFPFHRATEGRSFARTPTPR
jgi:putative transposase